MTEQEKTEQETIERLKKDYAGVLSNLSGAKLHYIVIGPKRDIGFVLREPTLKELKDASKKFFIAETGNAVDAGEVIFESCLIPGAIDAVIMEKNRLKIYAYIGSANVIFDDGDEEEKKS